MRRRQFISLFGGAAMWPLAARAQKPNRMRRIGVLMSFTAGDVAGLRRAGVFTQKLQDLGWIDGQNARIDYRWSGGDIEQIRSLANELVGSTPDVLVGIGQAPTAALQQATRTIPIVFIMFADPVDQGLVESLARPGGNATGLFTVERSMGGKWLELLKDIVPGLRRVAGIFNPDTAETTASYLHSVEAAAASFSIEAAGAPIQHEGDIERVISSLAREPGGGLIVLPDVFNTSHRKQMIELAAQYRLPTISTSHYFAADGGLLCYGAEPLELYRL